MEKCDKGDGAAALVKVVTSVTDGADLHFCHRHAREYADTLRTFQTFAWVPAFRDTGTSQSGRNVWLQADEIWWQRLVLLQPA